MDSNIASERIAREVSRTSTIEASAAVVWEALTKPGSMKQWMADPDVGIDVIADWREGGSILVTGFHHERFENKGTVLCFEPPTLLRYSHLSSLSQLPDTPENHSIFEFRLASADGRTTELTVTISNFPTYAIFKHLDFYWRVTIGILKDHIEK